MIKKRHTASVLFIDDNFKRVYLGITNVHWPSTRDVTEIETIGGALERGETPKGAAIREVEEEIGVDLMSGDWKISKRSFYMMSEGHTDTLFIVYVNDRNMRTLRDFARHAYSVRRREDKMAMSGICSIDMNHFIKYAGSEFGRKTHMQLRARDIGGRHPVNREIRRENLPVLRSFAIWAQKRIGSVVEKDSDEGESLFSFGSLM
jgi:hypothetical protein